MDRLSPARMTLIKQPSCRASRSNSLSFADRPAQVATDRLVHSANVAKEDPGSLGSARNRPKKDNKPKAEVILAQKFQYEIKHASSPGLALLLKALYKQNLFSTRIQMLNKNFLEPLSQEPCKSKLIHADQFFPGNLSELQQRHLSVSFPCISIEFSSENN